MKRLEFEELKEKVFSVVEFSYSGEIELVEKTTVYAELKNGRAMVGGKDTLQTARALFLFAQSVSMGKKDFIINQTPSFDNCGVMLDVSRGGVMRVEKVKEYIDFLACLGMDTLMLYAEDVYEMKEYPMFGYMRGRYTMKELKEIDDYGYSLGVELVPCIQTLAHMKQYLKWLEAKDVRDTQEVMMIDEPKTYELIECMIKTCREAFRSNRINVGLDEAFDMGLGKYLAKHGYQNRLEMMNRHVAKVCEICQKYDYHPMMWSDMYRRLLSNTNEEHKRNTTSERRKKILEQIPDIELISWHYGGDATVIENGLKVGKELNKTIHYAGGIIVWDTYLPHPLGDAVRNTTVMKKCFEAENVSMILATLWTSMWNEGNMMYAVQCLAYYSEYYYRGIDCTEEEIIAVGEYLTKIPQKINEALECANLNDPMYINGKHIINGNIFYRIGVSEEHLREFIPEYKRALEVFREAEAMGGKNKNMYRYSKLIFEVLSRKAELMLNLRDAYMRGDKAYLKEAAEVLLPELHRYYTELEEMQYSEWHTTYKPFGYEVLGEKFGGQMVLTKNTIKKLNAYLSGKTDTIEEFEVELLNTERRMDEVDFGGNWISAYV